MSTRRTLTQRATVLGVALVMAAGCATGRAVQNGDDAANAGDWDTAVAYYREALGQDPERLDVRVALEQAMRNASVQHLRRARDLEEQEQWPGAAAEYRLAADLDPANALAVTKALDIERRIREIVEASRPRPRIEELQEELAQTSLFPRLDPRTRVPAMSFPNAAVRDILNTIGDFTGINITYDQGLEPSLSRGYSVSIQDLPLEEVLGQVLTANQLTFKVLNPQTIFIYQDTPQKRAQFDDVYVQTFYMSHADANEVMQIVTQMIQAGPVVRPVVTPHKTANAIVVKATAPVIQVIERIIRAADRPLAEVVIEVEILEVNRQRARQLGIDLSEYALGFTLSPEVAPPNTGGVFPPAGPPPFSLNTISGGVSNADVYMTVPTAQIRLLESDSKTKILAKTQLRGREGASLQLILGEDVPVPQTQILPSAAGGIATTPQTTFNYRSVGVNVTLTPRVTYEEEIILDPLTVEKSGIGAQVNLGGQLFPSFVNRTAVTSMRLRDGESNLLAGLILDEDRETVESLPGIMNIPILRSLFGNSDVSRGETDIIMIVTPHIVRGKALTVDDLRPLYVGTGTNMGTGATPTLISPNAPPPPATAPPGGGGVTPPAVQGGPPTELPPVTAGRDPVVVAIQPVGVEPAESPEAQVVITAPGGELQAGGPPDTVPLTVSGVSQVGTVALTVTYDPAVLRATSVSQGTFMAQGGVTPTFVPRIDADLGRIDIAVTRAGDETGASGAGLLAGLVFEAVAPGASTIAVTGVVTTASGDAIQVRMVPAQVVVR